MPRPLEEWQDEIAAEMLEDLEEITGVSIGEMLSEDLAEQIEDAEKEYEVYPVFEEPSESEELDMDSDAGDSEDFYDDLFDDLDIDADTENDIYGDEGV